jgi:hypothetical protein
MFRAYIEGTDVATAADIADLYDAAIAVEVELGTNPARNFGSLEGLLFASGQVYHANGYWRALQWGRMTVMTTLQDRTLHAFITWPSERFTGQSHEWGDDQAVVFATHEWEFYYLAAMRCLWMEAWDKDFANLTNWLEDIPLNDWPLSIGYLIWNIKA